MLRVTVLYLLALMCLSFMVLIGAISPFSSVVLKGVFTQKEAAVLINCSFIALLGGTLYCLRSTYLQVCVKKKWDPEWIFWYWVRPLVSFGMGAVAFIFLKAGLLVLDADLKEGQSDYGYLAFAFIAGLNVDKFIGKIESLAKSVWGVETSRQQSKDKE